MIAAFCGSFWVEEGGH